MRILRIEIRNDSVVLDGYVTAVKRDSRPIPSQRGKFIEQIEERAFQNALDRAQNIDLLLNHDTNKHLGSTKEGNLELFEDNIGLRAICTVTDADVIEKAKNKQLRGWSFGFYTNKDRWEDVEGNMQRRYVEDLDIFEVSIIDNTKTPAYIATSIEQRDNKEVVTENRFNDFKAITIDETTEKINVGKEEREVIDYSLYEKEIELLKLKA
ncbi:HK97 family phage prohead protease [Clostridium sp.]|uniref:HK97 family phage prohead protease n=1 Tax=Clostridium sp. TaxID=1506 RepID=UPI002580B5E6|nr:HK97 family phage prohead protease [Clostridium sp.]MDU4479233.1 HK97 family phage prohead protease [Clostridium sp.]